MKDTSVIDSINPTFIALCATAINHCLSAWEPGEFRILPELGPGGGAQRKWNTRIIQQVVNNACSGVSHRLNVDCPSSSHMVRAKPLEIYRWMICRRIHSTSPDPAMAQPQTNQGSFDEVFLDYVPEELWEQPDNSFNRLSSCVTATEASRQFSAVLPMGGSAIASSSQPVPCSNSNSNSNNITNIISVENAGLVNGSTIVEGAMPLGG